MNAFNQIQTSSDTDINGLLMIISALFKACNDQPLILEMFKLVCPNITILMNTMLIRVIE